MRSTRENDSLARVLFLLCILAGEKYTSYNNARQNRLGRSEACSGGFFPGEGVIMLELSLRNIEKYYGIKHVLRGVTLEVNQGERIGLLGRNGAGKTTLFQILAGHTTSDCGERMLRKGATVGLLDQIPVFPPEFTAEDVLYSVYGDLFAIQKEMADLEARLVEQSEAGEILEKYGRLQLRFEAGGGYRMEENIGRVYTGLQLDPKMRQTLFNKLSGGEKTKVLLARLLLTQPDILLLDEPTNHLDMMAIEWLEGFLGEYGGTVVVISHDRYFLDRVVTRIVELVDGRAENYSGNYSFFIIEKGARRDQQQARYDAEQKKIQQLEAAARRLHDWAQQADNPNMHRQAFNIEKRVARMEKTPRPVRDAKIRSLFSETGFSSEEVLVFQGIAKRMGDRVLFDGVDLVIRRGDRVAILGENGSGKSTLLKTIIGEAQVDAGVVRIGASTRYGYLPQEVTFDEPKLTILETICRSLGIEQGIARGLLAKYLFRNDDVHRLVGNLSGGEKSRLKLCLLMQQEVNLLLLDEPTNHLDTDSREWLEKALGEFGGTVLLVSHDRYFVEKFAARIVELKDGTIACCYGGYEEYRQERRKPEIVSVKTKAKPVARENKAPSANKPEPAKTEEAISLLEGKLVELDEQMRLCGSDYTALEALLSEKTEVERQLDELYQEWVGQNITRGGLS